MAVLVDWGQHLTASDLKTMLMRADVYKHGDSEDNNQDLIRSRLLGARDAALHADAAARRGLLIFATVLVQQTLKETSQARQRVRRRGTGTVRHHRPEAPP